APGQSGSDKARQSSGNEKKLAHQRSPFGTPRHPTPLPQAIKAPPLAGIGMAGRRPGLALAAGFRNRRAMLANPLSRSWNRWMVPLGHWLRGRPRVQIELFCLAFILLIGALDYEAGLSISLSPLYAAPISLAAWFVGPESAFALALF